MIKSNGAKFIRLNSVTSTNDYCKSLPAENLPVTVSAREQTGGRGRFGRSFWSPPGGGIYMSYAFEPEFDSSLYPRITAAAAGCSCRVLEKIKGERLGIKWVNDIYRGKLKICGILSELISGERDRLIIGVGVNVWPGEIPDELLGVAGSLYDEAPRDEEHGEQLISEITELLTEELRGAFGAAQPQFGAEMLEYYRQRCILIGREVKIRPAAKAEFSAEVMGIDENFGLMVKTPDGAETTLMSGEVSLHA